jgi:4-hydroxy-3-polyprenylbenzoate decarboxylase
VVGVTGASGAVFAMRLIQVLVELGRETHVVISPPGRTVLEHELDFRFSSQGLEVESFLHHARLTAARFGAKDEGGSTDASLAPVHVGRLHWHAHDNYMAPIASGSFRTSGMVVCPCSGGTLAALACGLSQNLVHRAASVHLKERRPLIIVPRETPLSLVYLDNLRRVCELGGVVLPAMPGWYQGVQCLADLVDFIVARILDQLAIEHTLSQRWGSGDLTTD